MDSIFYKCFINDECKVQYCSIDGIIYLRSSYRPDIEVLIPLYNTIKLKPTKLKFLLSSLVYSEFYKTIKSIKGCDLLIKLNKPININNKIVNILNDE